MGILLIILASIGIYGIFVFKNRAVETFKYNKRLHRKVFTIKS